MISAVDVASVVDNINYQSSDFLFLFQDFRRNYLETQYYIIFQNFQNFQKILTISDDLWRSLTIFDDLVVNLRWIRQKSPVVWNFLSLFLSKLGIFAVFDF